jgi:hypothetical protein
MLSDLVKTSLGLVLLRKNAISNDSLIGEWAKDLNRLGEDLLSGRISPEKWQRLMDSKYKEVSLKELAAAVDLDRLSREMSYGERGEKFVTVEFPTTSENWRIITKVAGVRQDHAIFPHDHRNMVSAFLILEGEFRTRLYNKLEESSDSMIVEPTVDDISRPGAWSSISDTRNNVHWLESPSCESFLFSIKIASIDPEIQTEDMIPIDPNGKDLGDGRVLVRKISRREARDRFS